MSLRDKKGLFANYQDIYKEAIELIRQGAITPDDIMELKSTYYQELDFDNLVIDEGQDWPSEEVELLKALYDIRQICVADGFSNL